MVIDIKLPRGKSPKFLVLAATDQRYFRTPARMDEWALHRSKHMDVLNYLQECKATGDAQITIDGDRRKGGWARIGELRRITGIGDNDDRILNVLHDLVDPIGAIELQSYDGPGPDYSITLYTLPPLTPKAVAVEYREPFYNVDDPHRVLVNRLLAGWQVLYQHEHRVPYRSKNLQREKAALYGYVRAVDDGVRVTHLMAGFIQGWLVHEGRRVTLNLNRYPTYQKHGPTILTFVKIAISFGRQVDAALRDRAKALGVPRPHWACATYGERELDIRRTARGYAYGHGWDGRKRLTPAQRMPPHLAERLCRKRGLFPPARGWLDEGNDGTARKHVEGLSVERLQAGVSEPDLAMALGIDVKTLARREKRASKSFAKRHRAALQKLTGEQPPTNRRRPRPQPEPPPQNPKKSRSKRHEEDPDFPLPRPRHLRRHQDKHKARERQTSHRETPTKPTGEDNDFPPPSPRRLGRHRTDYHESGQQTRHAGAQAEPTARDISVGGLRRERQR